MLCRPGLFILAEDLLPHPVVDVMLYEVSFVDCGQQIVNRSSQTITVLYPNLSPASSISAGVPPVDSALAALIEVQHRAFVWRGGRKRTIKAEG